ncbi:MAG TPA: histidinol-phosphatase HisJ family protein [Thermomicrobiales bacterium]|nr:histidinol-phosphatase HisJ family protein [Thermomicrobiales bacterium]
MSPIPHDYHMHSEFSIDCAVPIADRCEQAIALGLAEICVTDHCDYMPADKGHGYYRPQAYFAELERCRALYDGRVTLRAGVEVGEWHVFRGQVEALAAAHPYDFIIGSLHWVGLTPEFMVLEPEYFSGREQQEAYEAYYSELLMMVDGGGFDVIGHLDVPKRAGFGVYGAYSSADFEEPIRAVLRRAIERGIGIEINTGTARRPVGVFSPPVDVLTWYRELGGEILTVGSDAHYPDQMAYRFDEIPAMLAAAGFRAVTCFEGRKARFVDLE